MKLRKHLLVGAMAAILAFAGVACGDDTADTDTTDPGVETTDGLDTGGDDMATEEPADEATE